jgi:hypothetical protein
MDTEKLIYWLEINTPNDWVRQEIIDRLLEQDAICKQKNELYIMTMSKERFEFLFNKYPQTKK